MRRRFYWDSWNREHVAKHSVSVAEAEFIVLHARRPFPRPLGDGKSVVWGRSAGGRLLQVIFANGEVHDIDYRQLTLEQLAAFEDSAVPLVYIIHARDLSREEKSRYGRMK